MKIKLHEITVRDLDAGCHDDGEAGLVGRTCGCQKPKIHFQQAKGCR
ncbi:MAG: hypothetical protein OXG78_14345 [Chloroflexi bacterium]|nr:hypothetical protein [Chloroflexota bacterium]